MFTPVGELAPRGMNSYSHNMKLLPLLPLLLLSATALAAPPRYDHVVVVAQRLQVEFIRRNAATGSGASYEAQFGPDLLSFTTAPTPDSVASIDATWERVIVSDPVASATQRFARVKVTLTP